MSLRPTNVALIEPQSGLDSFRSRRPEAASTTQATKKRRRGSLTNEDIIAALKGATSQRPQRVANKAPLTATQELRLLRAQVESMEDELQGLQSKWTQQLPDKRVLATAQHTAYKKREVAITEAAHIELQEIVLQQQLMFATLQAAIFRAPLHSNGLDIFKALHFDTRFGTDPGERAKVLVAHNERSIATVTSMMKRFTQMAVDKVQRLQDEEELVCKPVLPVSHIDITGCKDTTLVSSVFMSEIPHNSVEDVYAAALAYHDAIPAIMKRHVGVNATRTRLNGVNAPAAYWRLDLDGVGLPATVNHILCSELTSSHGMIHMDAVIDDPLYPVSQDSPLEFGISGLTITPRKEPLTGRTVAVTLRWVVLYRYKLLPDDPALRKDLEIIHPILNGDLITASVCSYIRDLQQQSLHT
ncbi:hypothetical protein V7S43_016075 [Phytophthora oleae]|uniref:START domain-containing protein n=1 Tax=Phytophthora oleae TaxID=2107226 RepID=A0ABD3EWN7_9STRA